MSNIKILDCTLRDGGYVNEWEFGNQAIKDIIGNLANANIDIIECGFLQDVVYNPEKSLFNTIDQIAEVIEEKNSNLMYVAMIAQPYINIDQVGERQENSIDGIRLTFHKNEIDEAIEYAKKLKQKKYQVFMQPVGTTTYSDKDLIDLIAKMNVLQPYAFYLVDTLGALYKNDLLRFYYLIDHNLDANIRIGFHSHNNLQLSFSNAQELLSLHSKREILIDSSVFGMGRGAGNLCTELLTQYINENIQYKYENIPLLEIIDQYLGTIFAQYPWGYSVPYYIAATQNCHPNYAAHFLNKQTLSIKAISAIIKKISVDKKNIFDKSYAEQLYLDYQSHQVDDSIDLVELRKQLHNKKVLVIAPGKTIKSEKQKLQDFVEAEKPVVISINFESEIQSDFVFFSNLKRFNRVTEIEKIASQKIFTSNIMSENQNNQQYIVNYMDLLSDNATVADNAGIMLLNLLNKLGVELVSLAGFDGFTLDIQNNYSDTDLIQTVDKQTMSEKNQAMKDVLNFLQKQMSLEFITTSKYN